MYDSEGIHQATYVVVEHKDIFLFEERHQLLMMTVKQRNMDIFLQKIPLLKSDPSNSALLLDSSRLQTRSFSSSCVRMCGWGMEDLRGRHVVQ